MAGELVYSEAYALQKEAEARGEARGMIKGQLEMLKRLVEQGVITEEMAKAQEAEIKRSAASLADPVKEDQAQ